MITLIEKLFIYMNTNELQTGIRIITVFHNFYCFIKILSEPF